MDPQEILSLPWWILHHPNGTMICAKRFQNDLAEIVFTTPILPEIAEYIVKLHNDERIRSLEACHHGGVC